MLLPLSCISFKNIFALLWPVRDGMERDGGGERERERERERKPALFSKDGILMKDRLRDTVVFSLPLHVCPNLPCALAWHAPK
jgi:hypothetical protein